jgi:hypothetical protein
MSFRRLKREREKENKKEGSNHSCAGFEIFLIEGFLLW